MGDRITKRQVLKHKAESLSEPEIAEVLDYINIMESLRDQASKPDLFDDELVVRQIAIEGLDHPIAIKPDLT